MNEILGILRSIGHEATLQGGATVAAALVGLAAWRLAALADERARWANDTADCAMLEASGNSQELAALQLRVRSLEEAARRRAQRERERTRVRVARDS